MELVNKTLSSLLEDIKDKSPPTSPPWNFSSPEKILLLTLLTQIHDFSLWIQNRLSENWVPPSQIAKLRRTNDVIYILQAIDFKPLLSMEDGNTFCLHPHLVNWIRPVRNFISHNNYNKMPDEFYELLITGLNNLSILIHQIPEKDVFIFIAMQITIEKILKYHKKTYIYCDIDHYDDIIWLSGRISSFKMLTDKIILNSIKMLIISGKYRGQSVKFLRYNGSNTKFSFPQLVEISHLNNKTFIAVCLLKSTANEYNINLEDLPSGLQIFDQTNFKK